MLSVLNKTVVPCDGLPYNAQQHGCPVVCSRQSLPRQSRKCFFATTATAARLSCQDEGSADEDESSGDEEPPLQGELEDDVAPSVPSLLLVTQKVGLLQLLLL